MQGVQPNAKARPITYAPHSPTGFCTSSRACRYSNAMGVSPRKCSPMTMMAMPATIASSFE